MMVDFLLQLVPSSKERALVTVRKEANRIFKVTVLAMSPCFLSLWATMSLWMAISLSMTEGSVISFHRSIHRLWI